MDIEVADKINFSKKDNKFTQHALKTEVAFFDEKFVPRTGSDLLIENDSILEIDIARTKLYFTEHIKVSETYFHANSGQINPTKPIPEDIRQAKVVVVDAGVVIKCKSKIILNLFIADNEDDFITTNYYYRQGDFSKELSSKFQFIPII
ncbi:MAG: hypothetical protein CFE24_04170 [Flavobacterium sp. BFFFF2]|nr:MAG: hypothetical protein CFE24_04170 [Flavobacterium sp. BFFFF2]